MNTPLLQGIVIGILLTLVSEAVYAFMVLYNLGDPEI